MRTNISAGRPFEDVYGYSTAVRIGDVIHVSGTTARDLPEEEVDAYTQAVEAIEHIETALREAGADLGSVVRTVTYLTDIADTELVARAHLEAFGEIRPAATIVAVTDLVSPRMKVEIEAYADLQADRPRGDR